jgi:hypothetical protein
MSQFEQENDLGRGGGEVDEETLEQAEEAADERRSTANIDSSEEPSPGPWAKTSAGDDAET